MLGYTFTKLLHFPLHGHSMIEYCTEHMLIRENSPADTRARTFDPYALSEHRGSNTSKGFSPFSNNSTIPENPEALGVTYPKL